MNEYGEKFEHHCHFTWIYFLSQSSRLLLKVDLFISAVLQWFSGIKRTQLNLFKLRLSLGFLKKYLSVLDFLKC